MKLWEAFSFLAIDHWNVLYLKKVLDLTSIITNVNTEQFILRLFFL